MTQAYIEIMNRIEVPLKAVVDAWLGDTLRNAADSFGQDVTPEQAIQEAVATTQKWRWGRVNFLNRLLRVVPPAVEAGEPLDPLDVRELQSLAKGCI